MLRGMDAIKTTTMAVLILGGLALLIYGWGLALWGEFGVLGLVALAAFLVYAHWRGGG